MGDSLVIVAVPDENDRVVKVSSEKVPHLTLLYLGEDATQVPNLGSIVSFVEHAANTMLRRFHLTVDRRGELGDDKADVLFFKKGGYDYKAIRDFRSALLQDSNIRKAYDSTTQFDGPWKPHLTLGYPETPAKEDEYNEAFYSVGFNQIQVWMGDSEGPAFLLKDYWDEMEALESVPMDVAMSDIQHYGVRGMKWGIRKDRQGRDRWDPKDHSLGGDAAKALIPLPGVGIPSQVRLLRRAGRRTADAASKVAPSLKKFGAELADSSWESSTYSSAKHEVVHNTVAKDLDNHVVRLQKSPKYRGKNLKADSDLRKTYYEDVAKVTDAAYRRGVKDVYGDNYTGTKSAHYVNDARGPRIEVRDKRSNEFVTESPLKSMREIQRERAEREKVLAQSATTDLVVHADIPDAPDLVLPIKLDDNGFIIGVTFVVPAEDAVVQTADVGEELVHALLSDDSDILEHYGVKGMKWGVRRNEYKTYREQNAEDLIKLGKAAVRGVRRVRGKSTPQSTSTVPSNALLGPRKRAEPEAVTPIATSRVPAGSRRKTKIETEGGENQPAHADAIKVARAQAKLKKSGTAALSNQELRDLQERLNLERNVTQLASNTSRIGRGRQAVKNLTGFNKEFNETVGTGLQTTRLAKQVR